MKKELPDQLNVQLYFDRIAKSYPERYSSRKPFHARFFNERLHLATQKLCFEEKAIWDIGAGTGALYDLINNQTDVFDYFACDLSEKMMAQSHIPPERRQIGPPYWQQFPDHFFDYIFVLGVTSYLPETTMARWISRLNRKLKPGGQLIMSFTNQAAWEYSFRQKTRPLLQRLANTDQLINQSFEIQAYTVEEIISVLIPFFQLRKKYWLHTSIPALSRLWPGVSFWLGKKLARWFNLSQQLSTDFLLILEARPV